MHHHSDAVLSNEPTHLHRISARSCAHTMRKSIVSGYTVAYATVGASEPAMLVAKVSAGGLVVLPARSPLKSIKFIFQTTRAKIQTAKRGRTVTNAPASIHLTPVALRIVAKNFGPASSPTAAKNNAMPKSRKAMLALSGM